MHKFINLLSDKAYIYNHAGKCAKRVCRGVRIWSGGASWGATKGARAHNASSGSGSRSTTPLNAPHQGKHVVDTARTHNKGWEREADCDLTLDTFHWVCAASSSRALVALFAPFFLRLFLCAHNAALSRGLRRTMGEWACRLCSLFKRRVLVIAFCCGARPAVTPNFQRTCAFSVLCAACERDDIAWVSSFIVSLLI